VALVTIDGEDARDFDDAVYCEPFRRGRGKAAVVQGWRLLVAIADVSHYVKPGEPLDEDAYERATSVYFPRRVIPMLPEKLSNGLCSLNPDVDRLADGLRHDRGTDGQVEAYQFYPAVIRSQARLTYTEVAAILANTRGPEAQRGADLVPHLLHLHEVYRACSSSAPSAARSTSRPPRRRSSATTTAASRRSCRARATRPTG
jgi:ribonuclease R